MESIKKSDAEKALIFEFSTFVDYKISLFKPCCNYSPL